MMRFEHTDTFGGEANYCWVKRLDVTQDAREAIGLRKEDSRAAIIRAAKRWSGLTGERCDVSDMGDMIEIRPRRICQIVFVTWED